MPAHADTAKATAAGAPARRSPRIAAASGKPPSNLLLWYLGLTPHWTSVESRTECRLLLRTHEWIADRVLAADVGLAAAIADLTPGGPLTAALLALAGPEADARRPFIDAVVANLRHALLLPVARRNEAWLRWLFLIPYSLRPRAGTPAAPGRRRARAAASSCSAA
jgi:hypothetical protein